MSKFIPQIFDFEARKKEEEEKAMCEHGTYYVPTLLEPIQRSRLGFSATSYFFDWTKESLLGLQPTKDTPDLETASNPTWLDLDYSELLEDVAHPFLALHVLGFALSETIKLVTDYVQTLSNAAYLLITDYNSFNKDYFLNNLKRLVAITTATLTHLLEGVLALAATAVAWAKVPVRLVMTGVEAFKQEGPQGGLTGVAGLFGISYTPASTKERTDEVADEGADQSFRMGFGSTG